MSSVASLRSYWRDSGRISEGCGLRVNDFILAHYTSLGLQRNEILKHGCRAISSIPIDVYLVGGHNSFACRKILDHSKQPLTIVKVWQCKSFQHFFDKYFNPDDFGSESVSYCATFVLLALNESNVHADNVNVLEVLKTMESAVPLESTVTQGMNVLLMDGKRIPCTEKLSAPNLPDIQARLQPYTNRKTGIVSYTFEGGLFFTVDLAITRGQEGSLLRRYCGENETRNYLGMVIFRDILPYPFEVFPLCISLKHVLLDLCHTSQCSITPSHIIRSNRNIGLSKNIIGGEYLFLLQCGSNVGSGVLVSDGIVLTCSHILAEHASSEITAYHEERPYKAEVVYKPRSEADWPDLALVQITSSFSCSSTVELSDQPPSLGMKVLAVGIPYVKGWHKKDPWISLGHIISDDKYGHLLATSAVHNGFSGGCLLDMKRRMIGIICGKAFPLNNESPDPLRLTQILPVFHIKEYILQFISSDRTHIDLEHFETKLQNSRKVNLLSKL